MSAGDDFRNIGSLGNFYGRVSAKRDGGLYYWGIDDCSGMVWEEIPKYLYDALCRFDDSKSDEDG